MKKKESKFRQKFRIVFEPDYFFALEPKACSLGLPDILLHYNKTTFFIELKFIPQKKKKIEKILRESQIIWFKKFPGKAFILFQIEAEYFLFDKKDIDFFRRSAFLEDFYKISLINSKNISEIIIFLKDIV